MSFTYSFAPTTSPAIQALSAQPQPLASLSAGRNRHLDRTIKRRDIHPPSQRSLPGRDRQFDLHVVALDPEQWMRLKAHVKEKVSWRTAVRARVALSCQPDDRSFAHARRDRNLERFGTADNAGAAAGGTHLVVFSSRPGAVRAGLGPLERKGPGRAPVGRLNRECDFGFDILTAHAKACACASAPLFLRTTTRRNR